MELTFVDLIKIGMIFITQICLTIVILKHPPNGDDK